MMTEPAAHHDAKLDELAQIIAAYNDVTEKLQRSHDALHAEVLRLRRQLASADAQLQRGKRLAALGEMAAGIAHEVRNPLGAIQLYARMVCDDLALASPNTAAAAENAAKIAAAVRGLNAVVTDVLHFAREIQPRLAPVDVQAMLRRAADAHRPAIDHARVEVAIVTRVETVHVDAELLHRALLNLIRNAVDAMVRHDPARPRKLTLEARAQDDALLLVVADTGPGIAAGDVDRLFNPFFTTRDTGTGLGLAIVHRILDAHGGAIAVHNHHGAVFTLTIPQPQRQRPGIPVPGSDPHGRETVGVVEFVSVHDAPGVSA